MSLTPEQIAEQYPAFMPLLKIPDIAKLLTDAGNASWSPDQFKAHLYATDWWRNTSNTARQWVVLELSQPGEAARQKSAAAQQYMLIASQLGVQMSWAGLGSLVEQGLMNGWNQQQIQVAITGFAHNGDPAVGGIDATKDALRATAADYGMSISDNTLFDWAKRIAAGASTTDAFTSYAKEQAKNMFPSLAKYLDEGLTVKQYADPYAQSASQILGVNANTVDWRDPKWRALLQTKGADGKLQQLSLNDAESKMMTDATYGFDQTTNAKGAAATLINGLTETLGKVAR